MKFFIYWIFYALLWEIPIFQSTLEWSLFCNFSSSCERHFETGQHCVLVCTACPPLSSWLYWQLLLWSVVWAVRKHWEGSLSISLEKRLWQQWATSAEARQKRCLDNGTKMEEPCWLQSWLWKVWGESFNNFIYHLHCSSSAKRRGNNESPRTRKQKRGKKTEGKSWWSFHIKNKIVAKVLKSLLEEEKG